MQTLLAKNGSIEIESTKRKLDVEELIQTVCKARDGDLAAYSLLVRRFQDMAVGYAYARLGDFHLAEDAAQEAFIEAHACLPRLRQPVAFPGWLRRIVFKHCDRFTRKERLPLVRLEAVDELRSEGKNPAEWLDEREQKERVSAAIETLPEHQRVVTALFYIGQFSHREIATFLGTPATTVKNRLHAARKSLKKELTTMARKNLRAQRPSKDQAFITKVMDDLTDLDDREVQLLIRESDQADLIVGLLGSSREVRDKVLGNMSERVRHYVEQEMEVQEPQIQRMAAEEVEAIQRRIMTELDKPRPTLSKRYLAWKGNLKERVNATPSAQMDFDGLKEVLVGLADIARHEGLIAAEEMGASHMEGLLRKGIRYAVDGMDRALLVELLEAQMQALLSHQEIRCRMIIEGLAAIRAGEHPNLVGERLDSLYKPFTLVNQPL